MVDSSPIQPLAPPSDFDVPIVPSKR